MSRAADRATAWIRAHAPVASTRALFLGAVLASALIVSLAAANLVVTLRNQAGIDATRRFESTQLESDEVAACRAAFSAELITGPTAAALKAIAEHGIDTPQYRAAADQVDVDRYQELVTMSRIDADRFLEVCRREAPD